MSKQNFKIIKANCLPAMKVMPTGSVDLVACDPPFDVGYDAYDSYSDKRPETDYLIWCRDWMSEIYRVLKPDGTFWLIIGDERAAQLKLIAESHPMLHPTQRIHGTAAGKGFYCRSWVIHYVTFGVSCPKNFARSKVHLFYFTKHKKKFTFNHLDVRVPSARQLVYNDKRANPDGKLPDNAWILDPRKHDLIATPGEDFWAVPRVCGTSKERVVRGENKVKLAIPQMPELVMDRIILSTSNPGDLVLDPMTGTGTTGASAVKYGRRFVGFDVSAETVKLARQRISKVQPEGEARD